VVDLLAHRRLAKSSYSSLVSEGNGPTLGRVRKVVWPSHGRAKRPNAS